MDSEHINLWFKEFVTFEDGKFAYLKNLKESFDQFNKFELNGEVSERDFEIGLKRIFLQKGVEFCAKSKKRRNQGGKWVMINGIELKNKDLIAQKAFKNVEKSSGFGKNSRGDKACDISSEKQSFVTNPSVIDAPEESSKQGRKSEEDETKEFSVGNNLDCIMKEIFKNDEGVRLEKTCFVSSGNRLRSFEDLMNELDEEILLFDLKNHSSGNVPEIHGELSDDNTRSDQVSQKDNEGVHLENTCFVSSEKRNIDDLMKETESGLDEEILDLNNPSQSLMYDISAGNVPEIQSELSDNKSRSDQVTQQYDFESCVHSPSSNISEDSDLGGFESDNCMESIQNTYEKTSPDRLNDSNFRGFESDSSAKSIQKVEKAPSNNNAFINYFKASKPKENSSAKDFVYTEKKFSFRNQAKESPFYDNLVFSRFFENFKTVTPSNLTSCNFTSFEAYLDFKLPSSNIKNEKMTNMVLRAKRSDNGIELRMNAFLCGAFPPVITGSLVSNKLNYMQSGISLPQFTALSCLSKVVFKCEICEIYNDVVKLSGKASKLGLGKLEGFRQLYEHGNSSHHVEAIKFVERQMPELCKNRGDNSHVSEYFVGESASGKGREVQCMFVWDSEIVDAFKDRQSIRSYQPKTLYQQRKLWVHCEDSHQTCREYQNWKKLHPKEHKELKEECKFNPSRSVYVPANDQKVLIQGQTVTIKGGIKSLDPPCLGSASNIGSHPFTCNNCHRQLKALNNLITYRRKKSSLPMTESRAGKVGMRYDYLTKTEKEMHYKETLERNERLLKENIAFRRSVYSKSHWQKVLLESCENDDIKKLVLDLVLCIEQKCDQEIKKDIIKNVLGKLKSGVNHKFTPIIKDIASYYRNTLGDQNYSLLQSLFCLPGKTIARQHGEGNKIHLGINDEVFQDRAVSLYEGKPVVDSTDEARTLRFLSGVVGKEGEIELVGHCWEPDIDDWSKSKVLLKDVVKQDGFPDEFSALKSHVDKLIASKSFAKDTGIHNLVSVCGSKSKPLIYLVWPTPNSGYKSGHLLKIWDVVREKCFLTPSGELRTDPVNLIGHASDSAGFQLAAAVSLMTPQDAKCGIKYLTLNAGESEFAAPYFSPLPSIGYLDYDHNLRLYLKCLKYETLDLDLFPCDGNRYVASINHLQELKSILDDKGESHLCSFSNNDLLFARFLDQNCDAALKVFTNDVADLLIKELSHSSGTALYIKAVAALFKPFVSPECDPIAMQETMSEGITVFRIWKKILRKKKKRLSAVKGAAKDASMRGSFVTYGCAKTSEILFCAGTTHMLAMYAHFKHLGPTALPLYQCGTKATERIISQIQGKSNQVQSLDSQPTLSGIMNQISKVQTNQISLENLLEQGAKMHSSTNRRRISHEYKEAVKTKYEYPNTFTEFKKQQTIAFKNGVKKGIDLYKRYCPEGIQYLQKNGGLAFLTSYDNKIPKENVFNGSLSEEYALKKLKMKKKPSQLLQNGAANEENVITNYLNPEDVGNKCGEGDEKEGSLIPDEMLNELESGDKSEEKSDGEGDGRQWYLSRNVNGKMQKIHLAQALKILIPREFVSRERSKRHIAANFLPDRGELNESHNVVVFRFVVAKIKGKVCVCKVASLNSNGKSVKSASNTDDSVTCRLIPLEKVASDKNLYVFPEKVIVSNWIKVSNILGEIKMISNSSNQFNILEKSLSVLKEAQDSLTQAADLKLAKTLTNNLPPADFREVSDILDKKVDLRSQEYLYLVKFKGNEENDPVWLNQSCFDRPVHFSKRKGFNEKAYACKDSPFMQFALNDGKSFFEKRNSSKRKSSEPPFEPAPKRKKVPPVSGKSKAKLDLFSFNKPNPPEKNETKSSVVDLANIKEQEHGYSDEQLFEDAVKKLKSGDWVCDVIIEKATHMLKSQFPDVQGLQYSMKSKSQLSNFGPVTGDSIQIHHDGGFHWVVSTSKGDEIFVYDSLYPKPSQNLSTQLRSCYKNFIKKDGLKVQYKNVSKQNGQSDCGVYAIAYAFDIASGKSPDQIVYNQCLMRKHLVECIEKDSLSSFPVVVNNYSASETSPHFILK